MHSFLKFALSAVGSMVASAAIAGPLTTIDFDELDSMTFWAGSVVPQDARLSNQLIGTHGVVFASGDPWVAVVQLGLGHATSGSNGIASSRAGGVLTYDKAFPISASFFDPNDTDEKAVTDFVSLRVDLWGSGQSVWLRGFDVQGREVAAASAVDMYGTTLSISAPGIHSVQFLGTQDNGGAGVDDFTFGALKRATVPEPDSLALVLLPLTGLCVARRSRFRACQLPGSEG